MTLPMLFDTHCHLDFSVFEENIFQLFESAQKAGVDRFIVPAVGAWNWARVSQLSEQFNGVYYALGLHPYFFRRHQAGDIDALALALESRSSRCVAVGECGLDTFGEHPPIAEQVALLAQHIDLANAHQLPMIFHSRKTHDVLLKCLKQKPVRAGGVLHGFTGSYQQAMAFVKLGLCIGVGGSITYPRANKTREAIRQLPLESLVLETDSPDMPVAGFQGQPNVPARLPIILNTLAELRSQPVEEVALATIRTSCHLFKV